MRSRKSPPDGYTPLMMSNMQTVNESLMQNKPYALMRFLVPVAPVNYSDLFWSFIRRCRAANVAELIAPRQIRRESSTMHRRAPGRRITWRASSSRRWRTSTSFTPLQGSPQARTDALAARSITRFDVCHDDERVRTPGRVKALATTGKVRSFAPQRSDASGQALRATRR
jgi:hypothetical protein